MLLLHLFNLVLEIVNHALCFRVLLFNSVDIFNSVFQLILESHIVADDITDALILNAIIGELIE